MNPTKFFALGGMMEIGKTTLVVEHDDEIVIVDAGIKFANSMKTGVDGIIPDYSYLKENSDKINGLFITHGHEDHIGGIPYLISQVHIKKIYAPRLAIEYIKARLKDKKIRVEVEFEEITAEKVFKFNNLEVDFWTSQHSIPDSFGIRVKTPNGYIFDTGDFRFDETPIGNLSDYDKLNKMAKDGIDILISDSTNSMSPDHSPSEQGILIDIEKIIVENHGKVIFTTFASNLNRLKAVIEIAVKHDKKIVVFGRSMNNAIKIARNLDLIDFNETTFVDKRTIGKYEDDELLILSTGSQGEEMAALSRMATGRHPQIQLKKDDVIIFSSSAIPGNRMNIELLINKLYKVGATTKENKINGILHTSGHAYKDEHQFIFETLKPKNFVPYHGAYRQSAVHGYTAVEYGVNPDNVFLINNGDVLYLKEGKVSRSNEFIDPGPIYIDGNIASKATSSVIKKREVLGVNGFINVMVTINREKNDIIGKTKIISRGSLYVKGSQELMRELQGIAHSVILYSIKNIKNWDKQTIKTKVKNRIEPFIYRKKRRKPVIITSINFKD